MTQFQQILSMLRASPNKTVSCQELADARLYHKAATRIGEGERKYGHVIQFHEGGTPMKGFYHLVHDNGDETLKVIPPTAYNPVEPEITWGLSSWKQAKPKVEPVQIKEDSSGQLSF